MRRPVLFSLCIVLLLSLSAASVAVTIGMGPVELDPDVTVNITPVNSTETYEVPQTTVLGALDDASNRGDFEYQVAEDLPLEEGNLSILSIAGIENEILNETPNNWTYWVNDEQGTTGPAVTNVTDGDNLTFSYGPPEHTIEDAAYTMILNVTVLEAVVTPEPTPTVNVTPTPTVNVTPTPTVNVTPTPTVNVTPTPTVNVTPTPTVNVTPTPTVNVTPTPTVNVTPTPTVEANVTIVEPLDGATLPAGNVTVEVNLTDFALVEPTGQENAPGEGHLHYYLDAVVPTNESEPAVPEFGGYVISTNLSHTWENVTEGEHNLSVQVVNNDHTPLIPLAFETVNVTVGGENVTPTPTVNVTPTPTVNVTPTPTVNVTPTPTVNVTPTPTMNVTPTPTVNVTPTPTVNVTPTPTVNVTPTPTVNVTPTPTVTPPGDEITREIVDGLSGEENLTTFVGALNNSTIGERLEENASYVICAPTDDAFAGIDNQTLSVILSDTTLLNSILEYHVIQGDYTIEDLVLLCQNSTDGQISLPTVEGTDVNVSFDNGQLTINNFIVITQIQITNNIIVYVIDGVLIPPDSPVPTPSPTPTMNVTPTPTVNVTPTPTTPPVQEETMDLQLYEGWNFVSIPRPLSPGNDTAASVFADVETDGRPIYTYTPAGGFEPLGENETLSVLEGYWVYSTEETTVQLNLSTNPVRAPALKTLSPGWNAIGHSDLVERSADETLRSVEDIWVYVVGYDAGDQTYRAAVVNNETDDQGLFPTEGYWLFVREDGRLAAISA